MSGHAKHRISYTSFSALADRWQTQIYVSTMAAYTNTLYSARTVVHSMAEPHVTIAQRVHVPRFYRQLGCRIFRWGKSVTFVSRVRLFFSPLPPSSIFSIFFSLFFFFYPFGFIFFSLSFFFFFFPPRFPASRLTIYRKP